MWQLILSRLSIIGGAITLYSNADTFLKLANWANWLVENWNNWSSLFWRYLFSFINISIPDVFIGPLTFAFFVILMSISVKLRVNRYKAVHGRARSLGNHIVLEDGDTESLDGTAGRFFNSPILILAQIVLFSIIVACFYGNPYEKNSDFSPTIHIVIIIGIGILASIFAMMVRHSFSVRKNPWWSVTLTERLFHTVIGLALLIGMNELSKWGLDLSPPT